MKRKDEKYMKKRLLAVVMAAAMVFGMTALTACGGDSASGGDAAEDTSGDAAETEGDTIVVGIDDTFAPMGFRDEEGNIVGFDIDLANAVGEELGMSMEFKVIDWDAKEIELKAGTVDCLWNGLSVTPERMEAMAFSNRYLNNKIVLMSLADGGPDVQSGEELADLKIGTQVDSSALQMLEADPAYDSFAGNITEYDTYDLAIMDLKAGRVDVIAVDQVLGEYTNNNLGGEMKECAYDLGDDFYAIGFAQDNTELRDKVNEALQTLVDDGTAAEISEKWFGRDIVICEPIE